MSISAWSSYRGASSSILVITVLLTVLASLAPVAASAAAPDVCPGYGPGKRLEKLGGPNAFAKPVSSLAELQARLDALEPDIRFILDQRGMGHLVGPLMQALRSGKGVTERDLAPGEILQWMAFRKKGEPQSYGDVCVATKKSYGAFEIQVVTEEETAATTPLCGVAVRRDCQGGIEVDASSSSPGVKVTMDGRTILSGTESARTWKGKDEAIFTSDLEFQVSAQATGTKKVTTTTFLLPKICLNLAYLGARSEQAAGKTVSCDKKVDVKRCEAPSPSCSISLSADQVKTRDSVEVSVAGHWVPDGFKLTLTDPKGSSVSDPALAGPFPASVKLGKRGVYTFSGTATNEVGATATCSASVEVKGRWWVAVLPGYTQVSGDVKNALVRPDGVNERSKLGISSGAGLGVEVGNRYSDRLGLALGLAYAQLDSTYTLDKGENWGMDNDKLGLLTFTIGPQLFLNPGSRAEVYLSPFVGWGQLDDGSYRVLDETRKANSGSDFLWGVKLGVDIPFSEVSPWALSLGARYTDFSLNLNDGNLGVDPLTFTLGLTYQF